MNFRRGRRLNVTTLNQSGTHLTRQAGTHLHVLLNKKNKKQAGVLVKEGMSIRAGGYTDWGRLGKARVMSQSKVIVVVVVAVVVVVLLLLLLLLLTLQEPGSCRNVLGSSRLQHGN